MRTSTATILFLILTILLGLLPDECAMAQGQTASLQPGITVERALARGQSHTFGVSLEPDQFLQLVVDQPESM